MGAIDETKEDIKSGHKYLTNLLIITLMGFIVWAFNKEIIRHERLEERVLVLEKTVAQMEHIKRDLQDIKMDVKELLKRN